MEKQIMVTIFGDSVSKGIITSEDKINVNEQNIVKIVCDSLGYAYNNLSVYGQTLKRISDKNLIEQFIHNIDENYKNIVVISIGGNDSDYDWKQVEKSPFENHCSKTDIILFNKLLNDEVHKLLAANIEVVLCSIVPVDSNRYFNNVIAKIANKDAVMQFLYGDLSNISRQQEMFNNEIIKCALSNGCKFFDIRKIFLSTRNYLTYFCYDGVHPNALGQKLVAKEIINNINSKSFN